MQGYAETDVFSSQELSILKRAEALVAAVPARLNLPHIPNDERIVRCHELARAVGRILNLHVVDGRFGIIDHSWLEMEYCRHARHILDVYVPGALPAVQIVDMTVQYHPMISVYRKKEPRTDIRNAVIEELLKLMRPVESVMDENVSCGAYEIPVQDVV